MANFVVMDGPPGPTWLPYGWSALPQVVPHTFATVLQARRFFCFYLWSFCEFGV